MKYGSLDKLVDVLVNGDDLRPIEVGKYWVSIKTKEAADVPPQPGLRSPAKIEVRSWFSDAFRNGRYIRHRDRLFYLISVRDFKGDRSELVMTAWELIGDSAAYRAPGVPLQTCRVYLRYKTPFYDQNGQVVDYRTFAEVAQIETGRLEAGAELYIGTETFHVIAIADDVDDGVVRGLWLERI